MQAEAFLVTVAKRAAVSKVRSVLAGKRDMGSERDLPHAKTARGEWGAVARSTGLPACFIQKFEGECASEIQEPDWDRELKDFEYRVVRWLRWGQAQKSEDESK